MTALRDRLLPIIAEMRREPCGQRIGYTYVCGKDGQVCNWCSTSREWADRIEAAALASPPAVPEERPDLWHMVGDTYVGEGIATRQQQEAGRVDEAMVDAVCVALNVRFADTDRIYMLVDHEDVRAALTAALNPGSLGGGHG